MLKYISTILPLFFLCAVPGVMAQKGIPERIGGNLDRGPSLEALENKARKSHSEGNYYAAMQYYQRILNVDTFNISALEGLAGAATAHTRYDVAAATYELLRSKNLVDDDAATLLHLADIRYLMGRYADARQFYQNAEAAALSPEQKKQAQTGVLNCNWAIGIHQNVADIALDSLREYVNTPFAEYSNVWTDNRLYYSAYSHPFKGDSSRPMIQIFSAEPQADGSMDIRRSDLNEKKQHTAYVTFNHDKSVVYYAAGKYAGVKNIRFELYRRKRTGETTWSKPEKLPKTINLKGFTTTQPFLCTLPGEQTETLFFVSDRPGGKGKKDIWFSRIEDGKFSEPVNLAALNTDANDVTPFYHTQTGALYFSSNGRQGLGGFDIYRSAYNTGQWAAPEHLPIPLNSNANDVFYSLSENGRLAFFSSNRKGAQNFSEEECCYDIFKSGQSKPEMTVTACNEKTGDTLNYTTMTLFEIVSGSPVERSKVTVPGSTHSFPLQTGKSYLIVTAKPGFVADTFRFEVPQQIWDEEMSARRCLKSAQIDLIVSILDGDTLRPFPGATVVLNTTAFLRPDGTTDRGADGKGLASVSKDHPDSTIYHFPLQFQHEYNLAAFKTGFTSDSATVSTIGLTVSGDTTIRRELTLRRGLNLDVYVFDDVLKDPLNDVTITLIEMKTKRRWAHHTGPDSNDYHTVIHYDTRYRIVATKEGYSRDSLEFRTDDLKKDPFQRIRRELFLRPLSLPAYLPIVLYFDNDKPGPPRRGITSIQGEYKDTYLPYYNRKQEYIDVFCAGMTGEPLVAARFDLDTFFERRVKGEWDRMRMFSEVLYEMLLNGDQVNIRISGFASPLASPEYNLDLTSRRVSSILNHFSIFDGGIYKEFIESGQLKLIREPNGAAKAPKTVSNDPKNRRYSVFSVDASRERRVEIIGVDVNGNMIPVPLSQR
ncbi:MAG: hypothetical protein IPM98_09770 [Lewinellaceae bacterium]|nr:hypothetical protein [Lewinellaceae bacterium]